MAKENTATQPSQNVTKYESNERASQVGLFTLDTMEVLIDLTSSK